MPAQRIKTAQYEVTLDREKTRSELLAAYVAEVEFDALSLEARNKALRVIADTVGCALYGSATDEVAALRRTVSGLAAGGKGVVWGTDMRAPLTMAVLTNGTAAHARELDDVGRNSGHPGAVIVPAALTVAQAVGASGRDLIAAVVLGYEVAERVAESIGGYRAHTKAGWHSTGTCCTFGAAAAAGRLLGLDGSQMADALGISGSYTGGIWAFIEDGAMTKRYHAGKAAENGVMAALMASNGFTGPRFVFEAPWGGFCQLYAGVGKMPDPDALTRDFGQDLRILESGFKIHACCRGIHGALDAMLELLDTHGLKKTDIERIEVATSPEAAKQLGCVAPASALDAQLSMPYSLAVALVAGRAGPLQFAEEWRANAEVIDWCGRIRIIGDETISYVNRSPSVVRIALRSGEIVEGSKRSPRGSPEDPVPASALDEKFLDLASSVFEPTRTRRLLDLLLDLENAPAVALAQMLDLDERAESDLEKQEARDFYATLS